jgi:hypothetical protein
MADELDDLERAAGETPEPHTVENPDTSFEPSDANIRGIFRVGVVLGVFCIVSMIGMIWLFDLFATRMGGVPGPAADVPAKDMRLPREPRLEQLSSPSDEQQRALDAERAAYGWIDRDKRIARIPIAEAMKMLPSKYSAPPTAPSETSQEDKHLTAERTHPPGPSSSGRIVEGK